MGEMIEKLGMGWLPDYPDFRDYTVEQKEGSPILKASGQKDSVQAMLTKIGVGNPVKALPASVDLQAWCSPIENKARLVHVRRKRGEYMSYYICKQDIFIPQKKRAGVK